MPVGCQNKEFPPQFLTLKQIFGAVGPSDLFYRHNGGIEEQSMGAGVRLRSRIVGRLGNTLESALTRLPAPMLINLEAMIQEAQGKGWGSGTVHQEVAATFRLLPASIADGPVVLDVGANAGNWTAALLELAPRATVHCFEPSRAAHDQLRTRFLGDGRVHPVAQAVGRQAGNARLWTDAPGSGLASLSRRSLAHLGLDFDTHEEISVTTLDAWVQQSGVEPDLIKLDVEGHELDVLRGGEATLRSTSVIQFEFGGCNIDSRTYFRDLWEVLTDSGFRIARISPRGAVELAAYRESDETFRTTNFIAHRRQD